MSLPTPRYVKLCLIARLYEMGVISGPTYDLAFNALFQIK